MRTLTCGLLLILMTLPAHGETDSAVRLLFDEATQAFNAGLAAPDEEKAAHFRTALAAYETLVRDKGIRSGALYYNIGNCFMRLDEVGEAVLNYRLAERSMPGNRELQANLNVALTRREDHIAPRERMVLGLPVSSIGRDVRAWLVALPAKAPVLIGAFTLVWVILGFKLVRRSAVLNALLVLAIIGAVVYGAAVAAYAQSFSGRGRGVLLVDDAAARTGPSQLHPQSFEQPLHEGVEFRVLRRESRWVNVELPDGARCWLPSEAIGTY